MQNPSYPSVEDGLALKPANTSPYMSGAADDRTIADKVRSFLDQTELYVDNYYQKNPHSDREIRPEALALFDTTNPSVTLARRLQHSTDAKELIKHALTYTVAMSVSADANSHWPLLPEDFLLLPRLLSSARNAEAIKPGTSYAVHPPRERTVAKLLIVHRL